MRRNLPRNHRSAVAVFCVSVVMSFFSTSLFAQGTFVTDQQSSDEAHTQEGGYAPGQQPLGQSFTPLLDSVGFIRLYIQGGGGTASFHVVLHNDSITGSVLGTSATTSFSTGSFVDFLFQTPVSVTPGTMYFFQPVLETATGGWTVNASFYNYAGGSAFANGLADSSKDLWFREGVVVVPEPSVVWLLAVMSGALFYVSKKSLGKHC